MECKFVLKNNFLLLKILQLFRHLTDATYDICYSFMDEIIDIWRINLQAWNLRCMRHMAHEILQIWIQKLFLYFWNYQNFLDIWQMRLMTFAKILWIRQFTYQVWNLRSMRHIIFYITKHSRKKHVF